MPPKYIISTDLDGTLIDHETYDFKAAKPAMERCAELNIPIVLNTSKTKSEVQSLQAQLGLATPFIVENGSALFGLPGNDKEHNDNHIFGTERQRCLSFIAHIRNAYNWQFQGFNDWNIDEIITHTGLDENSAIQASMKQFSEPFIWQDSEQSLQKFTELVLKQGLRLMRGGRFWHLQGDTNKAKPLSWLIDNAERLIDSNSTNKTTTPTEPFRPTLIALGDNHNDIAMLNAADIAVCVRSPVADFPTLSKQNNVIKTTKIGPSGWNEAVLSIIDNAAYN